MTLPQINIQRYPIHLACSKRDVEFRPFTVGEEKILLSIIESKGEGEEFEIKDFVTAFTQILTECTFNKVDISKLPTFDVEHLFIRIRINKCSTSNVGSLEISTLLNVHSVKI